MTDHGLPPDGQASGPTVRVTYPSAAFPPPPPFSLEVPGGWHPMTLPDAELAFRAPGEHAGFHANVVVRARRVAPAPDDVPTYLRRDILADLEGGTHEVLQADVLDHSDLPAARAHVRTRTGSGAPVDVLQLCVVVRIHAELAYVLLVTASVAEAADPHERAAVRRLVASLRVAPGQSSSGDDLPSGSTPERHRP